MSGTREGGSEPQICEFCADLPHRKATHCTKCHASWTRTSRTAHCPTCHRTFTVPSAFDRHLLKVGCTDPGAMRDKRGKPVFGRPRLNDWGTEVWSQAGPEGGAPNWGTR